MEDLKKKVNKNQANKNKNEMKNEYENLKLFIYALCGIFSTHNDNFPYNLIFRVFVLN